jgi:transcriptional regulator with XRE-family HTH domain
MFPEPDGGTPMNKFGEKIMNLRNQRNLTTKEIAQAVGIPQSRYSELEKGVRIPTDGQTGRIEAFFGLISGELAGLAKN